MRLRSWFSAVVTMVALGAVGACDEPAGPRSQPVEPEVRLVEATATDVAAIVGTFAGGPMDRPFLLRSMAEFDTHYGGADPRYEASLHVRAFFQNGGRRIWISRARTATLEGLIGNAGAGTGIFSLHAANHFHTLLVPELFSAPATGDRAAAAVAAVGYAASRGASFLLDPAAEVASAPALTDWVSRAGSGLRHRSAVLYADRIEVETGGAGGTRWIGVSGAAAGVYARNDATRGVWSAPAGPALPLAGALRVRPMTAAQRDALAAAGINPVVTSPDGAILLGGARTLSPDPEFRYLPVHRLTLHVEAAVRDRLGGNAGQASGPAVWARARADADAVLQALWLAGAFPGDRREHGYFVRCGEDTHTAADVAEGRLNVLVGFAPLRPAEFIVRRVTLRL